MPILKMPEWARTHILYWIRNPDKGSAFEKATKYIRNLPAPVLIAGMRILGYDALLIPSNGSVCAHLAFQLHGKELHMFSVWVAPELRFKNIATQLVHRFVEDARARSDIERVRISAGNGEGTKAIVRRVARVAESYGVEIDDNFFVKFTDRNPRPAPIHLTF
jgi:GNAT superfamily N-acetyltransferase